MHYCLGAKPPQSLSDMIRAVGGPVRAAFRKHFGTLSNILEHFQTFSNIIKHFGTFWNIIKHFGTLSNILEHYQTFWNIIKHFFLRRKF